MTQSAFSLCTGHIVFLLPGCKQLLSMFLWGSKQKKKKTVLRPSKGCRVKFFCRSFLVTLSNSVSVGCFSFQTFVGCKTSSFLLTATPLVWLCAFLFSFAPLCRLFLFTRGNTQQNSSSFVMKKQEQTGRAERGMDLFSSSAPLQEYQNVPAGLPAWRIQTNARPF